MPLVLQPIDQTAKVQLAQQLACWAKTADGMTDRAVQYQSLCVSPTGETLGRWTIPDDLCTTYGAFPFTGDDGQIIECPPTAEYISYYIYDDDVTAIDPDTCPELEQLATPTDLTVDGVTATTIDLSWDAVPFADFHTVGYSDDGGATWTERGTGEANSMTLTDLVPDTEYTIRVRANDSTGQYAPSEWSATVTAVTSEPVNQLATPQNLAATNETATTIDLSWDAVPDADWHWLAYLVDGETTWTQIALGGANSTTVTDLTPQTQYTFRVRANQTSLEHETSAWSAPITASTTA